eukprot:7331455-Pyramimonas_sp.AAC.1
MSNSELVKFRKTCQSQRKLYYGGVSASAKLVLLGDPAVHEALASALQWCRMCWIANHCPQAATVDFSELIQWWDNAVTAPGILTQW